MPAPQLVFGLEKLRWRRWPASDGGAILGHSKRFGDHTAHVTYEGVVSMGYIEPTEQLTLTSVRFGPSDRDPLPLAEIDRVVMSEAIRDVELVSALDG